MMQDFITPERAPWLRPLMDAAQRGKDKEQKAIIYTPFIGPDGTQTPKHHDYAACLCGAMARNLPWLLPLLRDAAAYVVAAPGSFRFVLPEDLKTWHAVEEVAPHTHMLPWVSEHEWARPQ